MGGKEGGREGGEICAKKSVRRKELERNDITTHRERGVEG